MKLHIKDSYPRFITKVTNHEKNRSLISCLPTEWVMIKRVTNSVKLPLWDPEVSPFQRRSKANRILLEHVIAPHLIPLSTNTVNLLFDFCGERSNSVVQLIYVSSRRLDLPSIQIRRTPRYRRDLYHYPNKTSRQLVHTHSTLNRRRALSGLNRRTHINKCHDFVSFLLPSCTKGSTRRVYRTKPCNRT